MTNTDRAFENYLASHGMTAYDALIDSPLNRDAICREVSNYLTTDELVEFMSYVYTLWDFDVDGETFAEYLGGDLSA